MRRGTVATVRRGGDAGRVSPFLAIAFSGLLAVIGLSHDAAGQVRAVHTAQLLAAEAARAAGQAIDTDQVLAGGTYRVERSAAERAARDYLSRSGATGATTFNPNLTEVTVTVTGTYRPVFLSLFGASDRRVTGTATASLISGPPGAGP
jgi:hypothetical protein